jgi:hypothetical protein
MINIILLWVWQFPQKLLGIILIRILKAEKVKMFTVCYWRFKRETKFSQFISGVSLADIILLPDNTAWETVCHEYGHSKQSRYLGWLYLPIAGIYSAVFCNLRDRVFHKNWCQYDRHYWYYKTRWTEAWADKLGGVDRDAVLRRIKRPENARYPETGAII